MARALDMPDHYCIDEKIAYPATQDEVIASKALYDAIDAVAYDHDFIVIDTPGHDSYLMRLVHAMADTLITPLNDSFVDLRHDGRGGAPYQRRATGRVTTDGSCCATGFR